MEHQRLQKVRKDQEEKQRSTSAVRRSASSAGDNKYELKGFKNVFNVALKDT